MGCCASTAKSPKTPHIAKSTTAGKRNSVSKSPPPTHPLHEEETVKEVLSETPATTHSPFIPRFQGNRPITESPFVKSSPLLHKNYHYQNGGACKKPLAHAAAHGGDDLSEASEICSTLGESESASTTLTEKRENVYNDEARELRQRSPARLKNRSFSGEVKREKTVGRSPGRRSEQPSPNRARPGPGPGSASVRRKDGGESSGRRSRSPVTRTESGASRAGLGRTQSGRRTGKSPGRVGSGLGERARRVDESGECKWPPTSNESLENPLVSLECFIFL